MPLSREEYRQVVNSALKGRGIKKPETAERRLKIVLRDHIRDLAVVEVKDGLLLKISEYPGTFFTILYPFKQLAKKSRLRLHIQ